MPNLKSDLIGFQLKMCLYSIVVGFAVFLFAAKVHAETISLGIYPPLIQIKTPSGTQVQKEIVIKNYGDTSIPLSLSLQSFTSSDKKNGEIQLKANTKESQTFLIDKVKLLDEGRAIGELLLAPKQQKSFTLSITVPKGTQNKDYYFTVLFVSKNTPDQKSNASTIHPGIGTNVLLTIQDTKAQPIGYIKEFKAPLVVDRAPVNFTVEVANQSQHVFKTKGHITVNSILLGTKSVIPLTDTNVLTNTSRYIPDTTGKSLTQAQWNSKFLLGFYSADLDIQLDSNGPAFHRTIYFYSLPLLLVGSCLAFLFISVIISIKIRHKLA